ncbi:hypothetical protein FOMPIDRAFT_23054, partial [Fomitopsis schrenkii]
MLRRSNIQGFNIPGTPEKLVAALFADDTSAFLSQHDSWSSLWAVLDKWCKASRARFNGQKTEVIPIGSKDYRMSVIDQRKIDPANEGDNIPTTIRIAQDGEPTRVLGAWIGNHVDDVAVWAPTLKKIKDFMTRWGTCRPSLTGKKHIVQMGPGGMSQYLTKVQGMPLSVEKELVNMIRTLIWGHTSTPPVSMDTLY